MDIAPMLAQLKLLEDEVSAAAAAINPTDRMRVYRWRPTAVPELPAIWNWIDDGSVEVPDTARIDDIIVVTATIAVKPSAALDEKMDKLVALTDVFRSVVDPALKQHQPLGGTAKQARRLVTRTAWDDFNGQPVMCMDMLIRVQLPHLVG